MPKKKLKLRRKFFTPRRIAVAGKDGGRLIKIELPRVASDRKNARKDADDLKAMEDKAMEDRRSGQELKAKKRMEKFARELRARRVKRRLREKRLDRE